MGVQAYPYARWPRLARREAVLLRQGARAAARLPDRGGALRAWAELLGETPAWSMGAPAVLEPAAWAARLPDWPTGVVLTGAEAHECLVLEVDAAWALWAVGQALGAEGGGGPVPAGPLTDGERGVLGYLAARLLMAGGADLRVAGVVDTRDTLLAPLGDGPLVVWPVLVGLAQRSPVAQIAAPASGVARWSGRSRAEGLHRLRPVRLTMAAEAGWARLAVAELRTVRPGDVIILDESWLPRPGVGRVRLRVLGACRTVWWCTADAAGLRLERVEPSREAPTGEGTRMTDEHDTATLVDRVGDAPVDITIEVARFSLPLEELGRLAPGEVVLSGRTIGERVVLRAGGQALATGELVDVDGEVGVRVLELT
jgi:type III secretion protein Q